MSQGTSVRTHFAARHPWLGGSTRGTNCIFSRLGSGAKVGGSSDIGPAEMITAISALLVCVVALLTPVQVAAQEARPRSILVLDQSDLRGPFYYSVFSGLRSAVSADDRSQITLYAESLDLSRFRGTNYEALLRRYLKEKYQDVPIGVVVAIGGCDPRTGIALAF